MSATPSTRSRMCVATSAGVPEQVTKAQTDVDAGRQALDAAQKLVESRQQLFKEGAIARRLVDEAQVAQAQARAQLETAQQHLQDRKSTRLNSSHVSLSRMPSSA